MLKNDKIEKRLSKSFVLVSTITSLAAIIGLVTMIILSNRYSYALTKFGFAQGDIGKAMFEFAEVRSSLRAAIGYDEEDVIKSLVKQHDENKAKFNEYIKVVEETIVADEARITYGEINSELAEYWKLEQDILTLGATTDRALCKQAQEMALTTLVDKYNSIYSKLEGLLEVKVSEGNSLSNSLSNAIWLLSAMIIIIILVSIFIAFVIGKGISRGISRPLVELSSRLKTFASGDLSSSFPEVKSKDEVSDMTKKAADMAKDLSFIVNNAGDLLDEMASGNYAVDFNAKERYVGDFSKLIDSMQEMRDKMTATLSSIEEASSQVSAGASNLADASQNLAEGATEQAGAVEELQATITNITEVIEKSAKNAEESYVQAKKYADEADTSRVEMQSMVEAMERINDTSKKIENIISEIESIASQTNLLSLNASIEAARAGEAGRGFAVVADQIRQLAEQSSKSALDTRELIESSLQKIEEGNRAAERAASSIEVVVNGIKQIADSTKEISSMSSAQAETMKQAELGINQISEVVQTNSATAEESSATSQELSAQAMTLDKLISQFVIR